MNGFMDIQNGKVFINLWLIQSSLDFSFSGFGVDGIRSCLLRRGLYDGVVLFVIFLYYSLFLSILPCERCHMFGLLDVGCIVSFADSGASASR